MILDWVYDNFSILEYLLCIELVVLLAAGFFYQVAKIIARTDRQDPLVRFYRVFWRSFFSAVTPIRELDLMQVEIMARNAGLSVAGDLDQSQLSQLDAPDLGDLDSLGTGGTADSEGGGPATPSARPIGRTGPEDDNILRPKKDAESRELKFARKQREAKAAAMEVAGTEPDGDSIPMDVERDDDEPIKVSRERGGRTAKDNLPTKEVPRAATSRFHARIVPFCEAESIVGYQGGEVVFNITGAPEDGHANGVIISLIADRIGVRPYQISLVGGHYKVRKSLQVAGLDQATLDARIMQL